MYRGFNPCAVSHTTPQQQMQCPRRLRYGTCASHSQHHYHWITCDETEICGREATALDISTVNPTTSSALTAIQTPDDQPVDDADTEATPLALQVLPNEIWLKWITDMLDEPRDDRSWPEGWGREIRVIWPWNQGRLICKVWKDIIEDTFARKVLPRIKINMNICEFTQSFLLRA